MRRNLFKDTPEQTTKIQRNQTVLYSVDDTQNHFCGSGSFCTLIQSYIFISLTISPIGCLLVSFGFGTFRPSFVYFNHINHNNDNNNNTDVDVDTLHFFLHRSRSFFIFSFNVTILCNLLKCGTIFRCHKNAFFGEFVFDRRYNSLFTSLSLSLSTLYTVSCIMDLSLFLCFVSSCIYTLPVLSLFLSPFPAFHYLTRKFTYDPCSISTVVSCFSCFFMTTLCIRHLFRSCGLYPLFYITLKI